MDYINSTPAADGFRMPAEFERHQGCIMIWPERPGSWAYGAKAAKKAFAQIASVISESEQVYMIVSEGRKEEAAKMLPETQIHQPGQNLVKVNYHIRLRLLNVTMDQIHAFPIFPQFLHRDIK
mgnify:CR=1 FL=1